MTRRLTIVALTVLLAGCGFLSRKKSSIFALERVAPAAGVVGTSGVPVGVDVVELPPGLDRRDIVVKKENGRVEIRETDQWQSLLEPLVLHTVAFNLASRLPEGMVILPGQPIPTTAKRAIDLVFEEFAAGPEQRFTLDVRWTLRQSGVADRAGHERITVDLQSLDSAEVARGGSVALGMLADRIVAGL
jgi:uncharacterized lipoprotein YmbA